MGWASAGASIFDPVMKALQESNATAETKTSVAKLLINVLQGQDWDTEDESLEEFSDDPSIVEAFAEYEVYLYGTPEYHARWGY
jgi:hypothetical protein